MGDVVVGVRGDGREGRRVVGMPDERMMMWGKRMRGLKSKGGAELWQRGRIPRRRRHGGRCGGGGSGAKAVRRRRLELGLQGRRRGGLHRC